MEPESTMETPQREGGCSPRACSADVLPCPFCGFEEPDEPKLGVRTCPNCAAVGPSDLGAWGTISDQIKHDPDVWNRRDTKVINDLRLKLIDFVNMAEKFGSEWIPEEEDSETLDRYFSNGDYRRIYECVEESKILLEETAPEF